MLRPGGVSTVVSLQVDGYKGKGWGFPSLGPAQAESLSDACLHLCSVVAVCQADVMMPSPKRPTKGTLMTDAVGQAAFILFLAVFAVVVWWLAIPPPCPLTGRGLRRSSPPPTERAAETGRSQCCACQLSSPSCKWVVRKSKNMKGRGELLCPSCRSDPSRFKGRECLHSSRRR